MNGKFHHGSLPRRADDPVYGRSPARPPVAMRSYSQTTPDVGTRLPHGRLWCGGRQGEVAGTGAEDTSLNALDPPWVTNMGAEGSVPVAASMGMSTPSCSAQSAKTIARVATVLPDPEAAARDWGERNNAVPINHMVVIREQLAKDSPGHRARRLCSTDGEPAGQRKAKGSPVRAILSRMGSLVYAPRCRLLSAMRWRRV